MSSGDLAGSIKDFLRRRGEPASSLLLVDRFLKIISPSEEVATRILDPLLRPAGLVYALDVGWSAAPAPRGVPGGSASASMVWKGEQDAEVIGLSVRRVACAVEIAQSGIDAGSALGSRGWGPAVLRGVCLIETPLGGRSGVNAAPGGGRRSNERRIERLDWRSVSDLLDGAEAIFTNPRVESPPLAGELMRRGLRGPAAVRSLAGAVRGSVRIARGASVEEMCGALGCAYRDGHTASDAAENVAACLEAAEEIVASRRTRRRAATSAAVIAGGEGREDKDSRSTGPLNHAFLSKVPARPGVYRFYDRQGELLYVGKAADLRRRLSTHAARPAHAGVHRVEYEVLGSELEALLKEARLIAVRAPRANVQREVHERGRVYAPGRAQALLLPSKDPGTMAVVFVKDGGYAGWVRLGPRGGGEKEAAPILRRLFRPATGGRTRGRGSSVSHESEILNSWLARCGERVSRVDLDSCRGPASALDLLRQARHDAGENGASPDLRRQSARRKDVDRSRPPIRG